MNMISLATEGGEREGLSNHSSPMAKTESRMIVLADDVVRIRPCKVNEFERTGKGKKTDQLGGGSNDAQRTQLQWTRQDSCTGWERAEAEKSQRKRDREKDRHTRGGRWGAERERERERGEKKKKKKAETFTIGNQTIT